MSLIRLWRPAAAARLSVLAANDAIQRQCLSTMHTTATLRNNSKGSATTYFNFSTADMSGSSSRRTRRLSGQSSSISAIDNSEAVTSSALASSVDDESNPYKHIRIFRRDLADSGAGRSFPLSVDVPMKKLLDMFCDYEGKRCKLCNETFLQWHQHQNSIPHSAREALLMELLRVHCGTPEEIVKMWWYRLNKDKVFERIPELSHSNSHVRKRRIQYLLRLLKDRKIIVDTFNVHSGGGVGTSAGAGRTFEFERLEWLGDNVVKYVFNNRLNCIFPVKEGGIRGRLGYFQFLIDGNDGLARAYDFLELQNLTLSDRVVSKFKSDVVETLFGELQVYLWSTEEDVGAEILPLPFTNDMYTVRALVSHVMEEVAHVMTMYHIEYVLSALQRIVRENQLQFNKTDPSGTSQFESIQAQYGKKSPPSNVKVLPKKVPHPQSAQGAALYLESSNYERFKWVVPVGGLLPRPFPQSELSPTPTFLPHLQTLPLKSESEVIFAEETERDGRDCSDHPSGLMPSPTPRDGPALQKGKASCVLSISELKDQGLVTELI